MKISLILALAALLTACGGGEDEHDSPDVQLATAQAQGKITIDPVVCTKDACK